jgi:hypothetical protein
MPWVAVGQPAVPCNSNGDQPRATPTGVICRVADRSCCSDAGFGSTVKGRRCPISQHLGQRKTRLIDMLRRSTAFSMIAWSPPNR